MDAVRRHLDGPSDGVSPERQKLERKANNYRIVLTVRAPDLGRGGPRFESRRGLFCARQPQAQRTRPSEPPSPAAPRGDGASRGLRQHVHPAASGRTSLSGRPRSPTRPEGRASPGRSPREPAHPDASDGALPDRRAPRATGARGEGGPTGAAGMDGDRIQAGEGGGPIEGTGGPRDGRPTEAPHPERSERGPAKGGRLGGRAWRMDRQLAGGGDGPRALGGHQRKEAPGQGTREGGAAPSAPRGPSRSQTSHVPEGPHRRAGRGHLNAPNGRRAHRSHRQGTEGRPKGAPRDAATARQRRAPSSRVPVTAH